MNPITIELTPDILESAKKESAEVANIKTTDVQSIRRGGGTNVGSIGEEMFLRTFEGATATNRGDGTQKFNNDCALNGFTYEIKSKDRTVLVDESHDGSVSAANSSQNTDFYVFCSVLRRDDTYTKGQIVGFVPASVYRSCAHRVTIGSYDFGTFGTTGGGFRFQQTCKNLRYKYMLPPELIGKLTLDDALYVCTQRPFTEYRIDIPHTNLSPFTKKYVVNDEYGLGSNFAPIKWIANNHQSALVNLFALAKDTGNINVKGDINTVRLCLNDPVVAMECIEKFGGTLLSEYFPLQEAA